MSLQMKKTIYQPRQSTQERLRIESQNLVGHQLRQFINKEANNGTNVKDIEKATKKSRATIYRIKDNVQTKDKGRRLMYTNQERFQILNLYLEKSTFKAKKIEFVNLLRQQIEKKQFKKTTKIYEEYKRSQQIYQMLQEQLKEQIKLHNSHFQVDENCLKQFLQILVEEKIECKINFKTNQLVFQDENIIQQFLYGKLFSYPQLIPTYDYQSDYQADNFNKLEDENQISATNYFNLSTFQENQNQYNSIFYEDQNQYIQSYQEDSIQYIQSFQEDQNKYENKMYEEQTELDMNFSYLQQDDQNYY